MTLYKTVATADGGCEHVAMSPEEEAEIRALWAQAEAPERKAAALREERNEKLTASDWTQVIDAPVDQAAWAAYRQALRDLPLQDGFPLTVTWPTEPQ